MYTPLGEALLKTGERLSLGVVECPDAEWAERVIPFLGHKGPETREHIRRALRGPLDDLRTCFYVGSIEGRLVTEVMIVGARGVGILGHVFTRRDERRKGAYSLLMAHQMRDMARLGFTLLCLSTGFESPPYWIYHQHGFRSIGPRRGQMIWRATPDAEDRLFQEAPASVRPVRWDDWSWFDLLGMQPAAPDEALPRSTLLGLKASGSLESAFVPFLLRREANPAIQAMVLETAAGATAGFALLAPDRHWFDDLWAVDLYLHPQFRHCEPDLLEALTWPDAPCVAHRTAGSSESPWRDLGFQSAATLPRWLRVDGERSDLELWVRD
jgi:hypothetical protein